MEPLKGQIVGRTEFIALAAMMFATVAFSVDAMLPAFSTIARDLELTHVQDAAPILTIFLGGMALGTLFMGPLSDAWGRKPVTYFGLVIFAIGAAIAWRAQSFDVLLAARFLQGIGAAGPRIVCTAIIRDLFSGRDMARIMSLTLMVFLLFPAFAPMIGALIMEVTTWRGIFLAFLIFGLVLFAWFGARLRESLALDQRLPLRVASMTNACRELFSNPTVRLSIVVQTLLMAVLFSIISLIQPIFEVTFDRADSFPYWFGLIAAVSAVSSLLNARLVGTFGMRRLVTVALAIQILLSAGALTLLVMQTPAAFVIFLLWLFGIMFQAGLTTANLNAIAMEPMGHIAGSAASILGAVSTFGGALIAYPVAHFFDGTPRPLIAAVLALVVIASILMQAMRRAEVRNGDLVFRSVR